MQFTTLTWKEIPFGFNGDFYLHPSPSFTVRPGKKTAPQAHSKSGKRCEEKASHTRTHTLALQFRILLERKSGAGEDHHWLRSSFMEPPTSNLTHPAQTLNHPAALHLGLGETRYSSSLPAAWPVGVSSALPGSSALLATAWPFPFLLPACSVAQQGRL